MHKEMMLVILSIFLLTSCIPEKEIQRATAQPSPEEAWQEAESVKELVKEEETGVQKETELPSKRLHPISEQLLTPEEKFWKERIDRALAPSFCPPIEKKEYPQGYYQGPLIDTHLHLPAIPDSLPEQGEGDTFDPEENEEGAFGGPQALLGVNVKMSEIACSLQHEGTHKNFAFFPVYQEIYKQALEIANKTMERYPELFTPFIMPPTEEFPTVEAPIFKKMLAVYPNLFQGYGEVGSSPTEPNDPPPDDQVYLKNYIVAREHGLLIYYHLGYGHRENFERVLTTHPDLNFIWHGDALSSNEVKEVLSKHPNAYYGIDEFFGGDREIFELYVGKSKEKYLEAANKNFDQIIRQAVSDFQSLIEEYPDRVLWGTDRGDAVWNYDREVGLMQIKIARAFIGSLDPAVQEKYAYQNAERLLNER